MSQDIIRAIEAKSHRSEPLPDFGPGDTVKVHVRVREGEKERIQVFQGVVIGRKHGRTSTNATFRVRKISSGIGVERVFPVHSPLVAKVEVVRFGRVRRSDVATAGPISVSDTLLPQVTRVDTVSGSADGRLSSGESTAVAVTQLLVEFNRDMAAGVLKPSAEMRSASAFAPVTASVMVTV